MPFKSQNPNPKSKIIPQSMEHYHTFWGWAIQCLIMIGVWQTTRRPRSSTDRVGSCVFSERRRPCWKVDQVLLELAAMLSLKLQKRLAASVLECGRNKVWLDPNEINEISMANSSTYLPVGLERSSGLGLSVVHRAASGFLMAQCGTKVRALVFDF